MKLKTCRKFRIKTRCYTFILCASQMWDWRGEGASRWLNERLGRQSIIQPQA